jgi:hypothetical protein
METARDKGNGSKVVRRQVGNGVNQDLCARSARVQMLSTVSLALYTPFGSFEIGEFLSLGFLLLLIISNRGPSAGFRGEIFSAFSYSVILSLGGGEGDAMRFSPSGCTVSTIPLLALSGRVASGGVPVSPHSSPE